MNCTCREKTFIVSIILVITFEWFAYQHYNNRKSTWSQFVLPTEMNRTEYEEESNNETCRDTLLKSLLISDRRMFFIGDSRLGQLFRAFARYAQTGADPQKLA